VPDVVAGDDWSSLDVVPLPATSHATNTGEAVARVVDADGIDDVVLGMASSNDPSLVPRVWIVSGGTREVLHEVVGPLGSWFGLAVADVGDVDGDGVHDVAAGAPREYGGRGEVTVVSGATGAKLHRFVGGGDWGLGGAVSAAGDVDANGHADVLLGTFSNESVDAQPLGHVQLRSGDGGHVLHDIAVMATYDFGASNGMPFYVP